jgi:hypothetical protein
MCVTVTVVTGHSVALNRRSHLFSTMSSLHDVLVHDKSFEANPCHPKVLSSCNPKGFVLAKRAKGWRLEDKWFGLWYYSSWFWSLRMLEWGDESLLRLEGSEVTWRRKKCTKFINCNFSIALQCGHNLDQVFFIQCTCFRGLVLQKLLGLCFE